MAMRFRNILLFSVVFILMYSCIVAELEMENKGRIRTAPNRNLGSTDIDGIGTENTFGGSENGSNKLDEGKGGNSKVPVLTVAWMTLVMAAATGLGAVPFFFVELDPQWAGICNGMAAGVMLAASFDLVQEGQVHGSGSWVVMGILSGGIFIWLCKKVLTNDPQYSLSLSFFPFSYLWIPFLIFSILCVFFGFLYRSIKLRQYGDLHFHMDMSVS